MDRRKFLQSVALTTAGAELLTEAARAASTPEPQAQSAPPNVTGQTLQCEFQHGGTSWKVYEDLSKRDGSITFVPARGNARVLGKRLEATFTEAAVPFLGLTYQEIGNSLPDLLADKLLAHGDPDPIQVRDAAPPLGSPQPQGGGGRGGGAPAVPLATTQAQTGNPAAGVPLQQAGAPVVAPGGGGGNANGGANRWGTFVGTKECSDTMPVFPNGNTRTYHPNQYFTELSGGGPGGAAATGDRADTAHRWEGLLGGWMPAVHKVFPISGNSYIDMIVFGDVEAKDRFIVQTWHRTARIDNGKIGKVVYGYSYPAYPPFKVDPKPEEFYRALLVFANYWDKQLTDFAATTLPDPVWVDMSKYAVAKELMVRPGGVYPKFGAVDRDYYGSEYDGFQDTFTA